jgi:hypothetical protein
VSGVISSNLRPIGVGGLLVIPPSAPDFPWHFHVFIALKQGEKGEGRSARKLSPLALVPPEYKRKDGPKTALPYPDQRLLFGVTFVGTQV